MEEDVSRYQSVWDCWGTTERRGRSSQLGEKRERKERRRLERDLDPIVVISSDSEGEFLGSVGSRVEHVDAREVDLGAG